MADAQLRGGKILKTLKDDLLYVCLPIPIGVFKIIKIRRAGDVDAAVPAHYPIGECETFRENGALVILPGAASVFEQHDLSCGSVAGAGTNRIPTVFDDEHATLFIPGDRNRINDHGLRSH